MGAFTNWDKWILSFIEIKGRKKMYICIFNQITIELKDLVNRT